MLWCGYHPLPNLKYFAFKNHGFINGSMEFDKKGSLLTNWLWVTRLFIWFEIRKAGLPPRYWNTPGKGKADTNKVWKKCWSTFRQKGRSLKKWPWFFTKKSVSTDWWKRMINPWWVGVSKKKLKLSRRKLPWISARQRCKKELQKCCVQLRPLPKKKKFKSAWREKNWNQGCYGTNRTIERWDVQPYGQNAKKPLK